jgi:hypothetical protein
MMEFRYSIESLEPLLRLHCSGRVTASGMIELMSHISRDPQYRHDMPLLADLREATGEWDYSEAQRVRDHLVRAGRYRRGVRWAAVLSTGTLLAACHIVVLITDPQECGVHMRLFEDPTLAEAWVVAGRAASADSVVLEA